MLLNSAWSLQGECVGQKDNVVTKHTDVLHLTTHWGSSIHHYKTQKEAVVISVNIYLLCKLCSLTHVQVDHKTQYDPNIIRHR